MLKATITEINIFADGKLSDIECIIMDNKGKTLIKRLNKEELLKCDNIEFDCITIDKENKRIISNNCLQELVYAQDNMDKIMKNCELTRVEYEIANYISDNKLYNFTEKDIIYGIESIHIFVNTDIKNTINILVANGAKLVNEKVVFLDKITIKKWMNNSVNFWKWCYNNGIYLQMNKLITNKNTFKNMVETTKDRDNLNKWIAKASMLGILNDYDIDINNLVLKNYTGNKKNPMIPPVKGIGNDCFDEGNNFIEELVIPDTVCFMYARLENCSRLKKIKLSKNMFKVGQGTFGNLANVETINLENIDNAYTVHGNQLKEIELDLNTSVDLYLNRYKHTDNKIKFIYKI